LDDPALPSACHKIINNRDNEILVSAAVAWEIATKVRLGKLSAGEELVGDFSGHVKRAGFREYPVTNEHGIRAGLLPEHHRDPFDRMLAAQCQAESIPILSRDKIFDLYGVRRLW
jgi:PIN domain nuclease of toxin-antitoxin system